MKAVLQRVRNAFVEINGEVRRDIGEGLVILLGVMQGDTKQEADFLADKIPHLRIFSDEEGKLNISLLDMKGDALIISNFTLGADAAKGRRPSFANSAKPEIAVTLYHYFVEALKKREVSNVQTGEFGADMQVTLTNNGPVTIILDTKDIMRK